MLNSEEFTVQEPHYFLFCKESQLPSFKEYYAVNTHRIPMFLPFLCRHNQTLSLSLQRSRDHLRFCCSWVLEITFAWSHECLHMKMSPMCFEDLTYLGWEMGIIIRAFYNRNINFFEAKCWLVRRSNVQVLIIQETISFFLLLIKHHLKLLALFFNA